MRHFVLIVLVSTLLRACGLGTLGSMKDTKVASNDSNYEKLAVAATQLGWTSQKGTGSHNRIDDWPLQVFPAPNQTIIFTKNNATGKIAFTCKGGPLDSKGPCVEHANKLFIPAFGGTYK